ncbi:hypothetical protein [Pukyongiella litopenaei]|uniref:Yip1 domain-containing protein n=1 Tax=Pukyongiella litopenaei TaxID=2605946 RepID=A0A2S0MQA4_9RHOB|nr:hypothetical protein [Pukyongiella litopenaei]AVO38026.1 hypothetical protein C6Y53_10145 [Pukyongiella litopenaei]
MIDQIAARVAEVLPRYGATLWALARHPVIEVVPRSRAGTGVWDAVLFWSVSVAIFLMTRYIAFSSGSDFALFFVARGIASIVQLLLVSLVFFQVWRLFGTRRPLGSFIIATACIHGVVLPIEAVVSLGSVGIARIIDEDLFRMMVNSFNGCGQVMSLGKMQGSLQAAFDDDMSRQLWLSLAYMLATLPLLAVLAVYGVAYLRVLLRLAAAGWWRRAAMILLGCAVTLAGLSYVAIIDLTLFHDQSLCLGPADD